MLRNRLDQIVVPIGIDELQNSNADLLVLDAAHSSGRVVTIGHLGSLRPRHNLELRPFCKQPPRSRSPAYPTLSRVPHIQRNGVPFGKRFRPRKCSLAGLAHIGVEQVVIPP